MGLRSIGHLGDMGWGKRSATPYPQWEML